jgi:hypothetical protein
MAIEPVKIPQNVYIEDQIIGPLTLRQIITIVLGGGFSYALWSVIAKAYGSPPILITVLVWIPAVVAAAFALIKINDLTLMRICFLMFEKMSKAPVRTWNPRTGMSITIWTKEPEKTPEVPQQSTTVTVKPSREERIAELSSILDQEIDATDIHAVESPAPIQNATPQSHSDTDVPPVFFDIFPNKKS